MKHLKTIYVRLLTAIGIIKGQQTIANLKVRSVRLEGVSNYTLSGLVVDDSDMSLPVLTVKATGKPVLSK